MDQKTHLRIEWLLLAVTLFSSSCTRGSPESGILASTLASPNANASNLNQSETALPYSQKLTYHIGPFDLPANQEADVMRGLPGTIHFEVDEPIWVTGFEPVIEDSAGTRLPNSLLYLAIIVNQGESNALCQSKKVGNPFAVATSTMGKTELPEGYGYPILPQDRIEASVVLRNPTTQDFKNVFFSFTLAGESNSGGKTYHDILPLLLDLDPCDHNPIHIAPKTFARRSGEFTVPESGTIIKAYGLLQDFGVSISLTNNGSPNPFWEGVSSIDSDHHIIELPPFEDEKGVKVNMGDDLTLEVTYDNISDEWYKDATAAAMVYMARSEEAASSAAKASTGNPNATNINRLILR